MDSDIQPESRPRGRPRKTPASAEHITMPEAVVPVDTAQHAQPCTFVVEQHTVQSPSGDTVVEERVCGRPATVRAVLQFSGHRREESFPRSKIYQDHLYKWHMDCGPVCEEHRKTVRKDFGTFLPNSRFAAQIKSFSDQGFPSPDEKLTRLIWQSVEAPPVQNEYRTQIPEMHESDG